MPQMHSTIAVNPSRRVHPVSAPKKASHRHRQQPKPTSRGDWSGPPLSILSQPSPSIDETCTTYNEMLFWVGWFARFHTDGSPYVPYEVKTFDSSVVRMDGSPVLRKDGQPQKMRCVREVARKELRGEVEWLMISWHVGMPGVTFCKCFTLDDALAAFHAAPQPIILR